MPEIQAAMECPYQGCSVQVVHRGGLHERYHRLREDHLDTESEIIVLGGRVPDAD